jgi:hypothetical protein
MRNRQISLLLAIAGVGTVESRFTRTDTNADWVRGTLGVNIPFLRSADVVSRFASEYG